MISLYTIRGFKVVTIFGDNAFACVRSELLPIVVNITAAREHSPEVERSLRTIQERLRYIAAGLPFQRFTKSMTTRALQHVVNMLNAFPVRNGVSTTLSSRYIVQGKPDLSRKELLLEFGTYVQVHLHPNVSNTAASRTVEAIALGSSGNVQGSWYFQNLETGDQLHARSWTELNIPEHVIQRVNDMAEAEGVPLIKKGNAEPFATVVDDSLFFNPSFDDVLQITDEEELLVTPASSEPMIGDVNITPGQGLPDEVLSTPGMEGAAIPSSVGEPVADDADNLTDDAPPIIVGEESATLSVCGEDTATGDSDNRTVLSRSEDVTADDETTNQPMVTSGHNESIESVDSPSDQGIQDSSSDQRIQDTTNHEATVDAPCDDGDSSAFPSPQEAEQGAKQHGYNLRPTKARDYTHLGHTQCVAEPTSTYRTLVTKLFSLKQMSFKNGLKKHGTEAHKAMLKEFAQIKEKKCFPPSRLHL